MIYTCLRCAGFALLAAVVVSVAGQSSEERALNSTGLWSKYNLIVKPTVVNGVAVTTPPGDLDARYKLPSKNKYNHKVDKSEFDRPYSSNHDLGEESGSEEHEQYSQEVADDEEAEDDGGEEEAEEEEEEENTQTSEEQDEAHRSTTQRSQAIHHKAPVKVAVVEVSTSKSAERKHNKKKKGTKPTASTTIHHHHHHEDDDDATIVHQKGHKGKGVKKYKIKGLKKLRKYMLPLLLAYKLKFFTLVPLLLGGLILIVASTGFAGFFFALFAVGVGLKKD